MVDALSNDPVFPQKPFSYQAICVLANTTLTSSPDDTVSLIAAAANTDGMNIEELGAIPRVTTTAHNVYIYESNDAGTTKIMVAAVAMAANKVSTTSVPVMVPIKHMDGTDITPDKPLVLQPDSELYAGTSVVFTDGVVVVARGHEMVKATAS